MVRYLIDAWLKCNTRINYNAICRTWYYTVTVWWLPESIKINTLYYYKRLFRFKIYHLYLYTVRDWFDDLYNLFTSIKRIWRTTDETYINLIWRKKITMCKMKTTWHTIYIIMNYWENLSDRLINIGT